MFDGSGNDRKIEFFYEKIYGMGMKIKWKSWKNWKSNPKPKVQFPKGDPAR